MFEKEKQQQYEDHVQQHFGGGVSSQETQFGFNHLSQSLVDISMRGWDLGID